VMQPYQLVKDLRTGHEMGDVTAVLDGALDSYIEAYLMQNADRNEGQGGGVGQA